MDYDAYSLLGITPSATDEEIEERYRELRDRYQRDRFQIGEAGNEAAEHLQQLELAYKDIKKLRSQQQTASYDEQSTTNIYSDLQRMIIDGELDKAQAILDGVTERDAEWHYTQSVLFYKRSWYLESKKQLEFALQLEPDNQRYKDSFDKLTKILASNTISPDQLRTESTSTNQGPRIDANGNSTCTGNSCCDCMLLNCMCNSCCDCMRFI